MSKRLIIDLFAGCGGLLDGFLQTKLYEPVASVEWEKAPVNTLRKRLNSKWNIQDADESVIRFDMQRYEELFSGFSNDIKYGSSIGLDKLIDDRQLNGIIGGPPCQAYSVARRTHDKDILRTDYRNFLFEYYLKTVERYKPHFFVFENVPGMLSATPDGIPITDFIYRDIEAKNYEIVNDLRKHAVIDTSEYGVPQQRRRVILLGLNKEYFSNVDRQEILIDFYTNILPKYKTKKISVKDAIGDLPPCYPLENSSKKDAYSIPKTNTTWHFSRYHSERDKKIFAMLARDIETGENKYSDSNILKDIYNEATGANTKVHKYHVLKANLPSTTILAHLYKDGLRFIHYDSKQARSITVREAARLQSFPDDFDFVGSMGDAFKMIGNAVPPTFSRNLGLAINDFLDNYEER